MNYQIEPFNDHGIYISFGDDINEKYLAYHHAIMDRLDSMPPPGYIESIPGYNNLTIFYDPMEIASRFGTEDVQQQFIQMIEDLLQKIQIREAETGSILRIPVCYGGQFGPDLAYVADYHNLSIEEVIDIHSRNVYTVHMLGFAPGFPFLGGMDPAISTPRKGTPAASIPAGSVGIAGPQTGVYSIETPGGWQIIGRSPLPFFQPEKHPPSLLKAGDRLQFYSISEKEFFDMGGAEHAESH